jgi:hypothetical protein
MQSQFTPDGNKRLQVVVLLLKVRKASERP